MRSDREALPKGVSKADADKAETMEAELLKISASPSGQTTTLATTETCTVYFPWPVKVCGAIRDKYSAMGGPNSWLGPATKLGVFNPDGVGKHQEFINGMIYWHPNTGAHPVTVIYLQKWATFGYEASWVGYPTTDEIRYSVPGSRQEFQGAGIFWYPPSGLFEVHGAIRTKYDSLGGATGSFGFPLSDETTPADGQGRMNKFVNGRIYWSPTTGARAVSGKLLEIYGWSGFTQGSWGYPSGDQTPSGSAFTQPFQYGVMNSSLLHNAAAVDDGDIEPVFIDGDEPTNLAGFAADSETDNDTTATTVLASSTESSECTTENCGTDNLEQPDTSADDSGSAFAPSCNGISEDGRWHYWRKYGCFKITQPYTIAGRGSINVTVTSGIRASHKSGGFIQEWTFKVGAPVGAVGEPTFHYSFNVTGDYDFSGPSQGYPVSPGETLRIQLRAKPMSLADGAAAMRSVRLKTFFANRVIEYGVSTTSTFVMNQLRCDNTMKSSAGGYRQGCVFPNVTPFFNMSNAGTEAVGHVRSALQAGMHGASDADPLHREADINKRNANRNKACPRGNSIAQARAVSGRSCDEYPFASTKEGAASASGSGRTFNPECHVPDLSNSGQGYSVCMIDNYQNTHAGAMLGAFYGTNRVIDSDAFGVSASGGSLPTAP